MIEPEETIQLAQERHAGQAPGEPGKDKRGDGRSPRTQTRTHIESQTASDESMKASHGTSAIARWA